MVKILPSKELLVRVTWEGHISKEVWIAARWSLTGSFLFSLSTNPSQGVKKIILLVSTFSIFVPIFVFASFEASLKYGSRGESIIELQDFLQDQGVYSGKVDGRFGLGTRKAVIAFQLVNKLNGDGYFGLSSRNKANLILVAELKPSTDAEQAETGTVIPTTSIFAGCSSTIGFSITTGVPCGGTNSSVSNTTTQQQISQIQTSLNQIVSNTTPPPVQPDFISRPTEISIQSSVCNLSHTNLKTEYKLSDLLSNGNTDGRIWMDAYILNQRGQNYYNDNPDALMIITTSDHSNDQTSNGSGVVGGCGFEYQYAFYTTKPGTYTINYSALGLNKSVTITVQ